VKREGDETIRETPDVSGGDPCIGHTQIAVRLIVEAYRDTGSIEQVHACYPFGTLLRRVMAHLDTVNPQVQHDTLLWL
jgi:uncharacterized protein (DUF433 family)